MLSNPYATPQSNLVSPAPVPSQAETIRQQHLKHEASIKGIGTLNIVGGILAVLIGIGGLFASSAAPADERTQSYITAGLFLTVGIIGTIFGFGLRKFDRAARAGVSLFSILGLLGFPIGTILNGYFLYVLLGQKGKTVFSPEYRDIMAQTPHLQYRTSVWVWVFLVAVVVLLAAIAFFMIITLGSR